MSSSSYSQQDLPGLAAPDLSQVEWTGTRASGLARLQAFMPQAGRAYAAGRNIDLGPQDRSNVSALSPWIRHRLISEEEVITAVLRRHSLAAAEKFIQEVCWRTYWKGWLQMRPSVLTRFDQERQALRARVQTDRELARRHEAAADGATGIACFDAWAHELRETGWLHNHTRMWFASIWIFTLRLPWQLGADLFYKHLLDSDPASNTLSWRWVAGLHTLGKHYLARAANIATHTKGRFDPRGELDERAEPLRMDFPPPPPARPAPGAVLPTGPFAWLVTDEDLSLEQDRAFGPRLSRAVAVAGLEPTPVGGVNSPAARFKQAALADGLDRASAHCGQAGAGVLAPEDVLAWVGGSGARQLVTAEAATGLTAWALDRLERALRPERITLVRVRRGWDEAAWPHATAGFFRFKQAIPALVRGL